MWVLDVYHVSKHLDNTSLLKVVSFVLWIFVQLQFALFLIDRVCYNSDQWCCHKLN